MKVEVYSQELFDDCKLETIDRINKFLENRKPDKPYKLKWIKFNMKNWYVCAFETQNNIYYTDFKSSTLSYVLVEENKEFLSKDDLETIVQMIEFDFATEEIKNG